MAQKQRQAEDTKIADMVMNSAHQIWLAGLGAFSRAQAEGTKMFESLVKEGETVQSKASKAANAQFSRLSKSASGTFDRLEQVFEDRVSKSLNRLGVPTYGDIQALTKDVHKLNASVQELVKTSKRTQSSRGGAKARREASPHS